MVINFRLLLAALFIIPLASSSLKAQGNLEDLDPPASEHPYWIDWMQDASVNFYDVQAAFDLNVAGYLVKPMQFPTFVDFMGTIGRYWEQSELP